MLALTDAVIDVDAVVEVVRRNAAGAVLVFEGVTRDTHDGKSVIRLEYEAYAGMAEAELEAIAARARERWPALRIAIVHRIGVVRLGEASVVIAVSTPHRDAAYAASRFAIDALKTQVPIWKKEIYADGSVWKANTGGPHESSP
jgi:molybdopterin synthase catalytic subunit